MDSLRRIEHTVRTWCESHEQQIIDLLQRMIRAAAISEKAVQEVFMNALHQCKFDTEWQSLRTIDWSRAPEVIRNKSDVDMVNYANLIGRKTGTGGQTARSLLLNGHVDVVPCGELAQWEYPPFEAVYKDRKIYGRGSCDMLGGIVSMWAAVQALHDLKVELSGDLIFSAVVEEECGGAGSAALMLGDYMADAALIAEPTANRLYISQQGSQWFRIHIKGKAAHGGTRHQGISAIELSVDVIEALQQLERTRHMRGFKAEWHDAEGFAYPINIGKMTAGNWPSSVAEEAILEGRYGLMPGQTLEEAFSEFELVIKRLSDHVEWFRDHPPRVEWFGARWLPNALSGDHPWAKVWSNLPTRADRTVQAAPWGTDGGWLSHLGKIPVMVYGPGNPEQAHQVNEWIGLDAMIQASTEMACAICNWCGVSSDEEGFE